MTWCSPRTFRRSGIRRSSSPSRTTIVDAVPAAVTSTSSARTSAPGPRPNQRTATSRDAATSAMAATRASSAFSTATPPGRIAWTSSVFARCVASMPPKPPAWASPTMRTAPMSGVTRPASRAIIPPWSAPNSLTRNRVASVTRSIVSGAPTSLLKEFRGATVSPSSWRIRWTRFLVVVLPFEPVIPTTRRSPAARTRATTVRARSASAWTTSGTMICEICASTRCSVSASAAPASAAAPTKRCPSVTSPGFATKMSPRPISRESVSTAPATVVSPVSPRAGSSVPPTASASSARVIRIMCAGSSRGGARHWVTGSRGVASFDGMIR